MATASATPDGSGSPLHEVHVIFADLLLEERHRERWQDDPHGYASDRLPDGPARRMIAGLHPADVEDAAFNMRHKEAESDEPPEGSPIPARANRPGGSRRSAAERAIAPRPSVTPAFGMGMRLPLMPALFGHLDRIQVWEHIVDWYLADDGGRAGADALRAYAVTAPVTLHSLGLSVGGFGCLDDTDRIDGIRRLVQAVEAPHLSDHLALSHVGDRRLPHFVPLWRVPEQVELVVANVADLQEALGVRILLENPAQIFDPGGDITTAAFLNEVVARTGCGVLLDLENLRVNHANGQVDADAELAELHLDAVIEVHVAGGTEVDGDEPAGDTHDRPVFPIVLQWLDELLPRLPNCVHVLLERDERFDEADEIVADVDALHDLVTRRRPS